MANTVLKNVLRFTGKIGIIIPCIEGERDFYFYFYFYFLLERHNLNLKKKIRKDKILKPDTATIDAFIQTQFFLFICTTTESTL